MFAPAIDATRSAWRRTVQLLFVDFDPMRVLGFAVLVMLANCSGVSAKLNRIGDPDSTSIFTESEPFIQGALLLGALAIGAMVVVGFVVFVVGGLFLSSRGQLMLIDAVATGTPTTAAWSKQAGPANALWRFRVAIALLLATVALGALGVEAATGESRVILLAMPIFALGGFAEVIVLEFAAPVMYAEQCGVLGSFSSLWRASRLTAAEGIAFLIIRLITGVGVALLTFPVLCIFGCLLFIPGVIQAVLLPPSLFLRTMSMHWIAGLDDRYAALGSPG